MKTRSSVYAMTSDTDTPIRLCCGNRTFLCSKTKLMKKSGYFKVLYSSTFSDSEKPTHSFPTEVMEPEILGHLVYYINSGDWRPLSNKSFDDLFTISKAALYLQMASIEPHLQRLALSRLVPSLCLSQAKLMYSQPTVLGAQLLATCIWRIPWKLHDLTQTEDFLNLSPAELYWLLRNPAMVDPTGGVKGLLAAHRWIEANHGISRSSQSSRKREESPHAKLCRGVPSRKLCARFIFGLVEGLEEKISKDAPPGYCRKGVLEGSSLLRNGSDSSHNSKQDPVHSSLDSASEQPDDTKALEDDDFEGPLPVTEEDLKVIQRWREDDNVFRHLYETQKKCTWNLCFTGFTKRKPFKQASELEKMVPDESASQQAAAGLAIFSIDPNRGSFEHVADYRKPAFGYRIATYGNEVLVLGGERRKLGSGLFAGVRQLDCLSKTWTVDRDVYPLIQQRTFLHCWRSDGELVLLGGYERYRAKVKKILVVRPSHYYDATTFVERDTSLSQICRDSHKRLKISCTLQELQPLPEEVVSQRGVLAAVGGHLLLFVNKTLHVHCPSMDLWTTRVSLITGAPDQGFADAIPYGSGIYLTDIQRRVVYWMLVDPHLLDGDTEHKVGSGPPVFHAAVYGDFIHAPNAVCRVEDKLYGFTEGSKAVAVEAMHLRYNPFEVTNDLADPKNPPGAESTPAIFGNSSDSESGSDNPRSLFGTEVTPTWPVSFLGHEVTPVDTEGSYGAEVTSCRPNWRSAAEETTVGDQNELVLSPETVIESQRIESGMRNQHEFVLAPETVSESQRGESGIRNQHEFVLSPETVIESQRDESGIKNQHEFVLSPETVIESQRGESGIRNQHEFVRAPETVSESQRGESGIRNQHEFVLAPETVSESQRVESGIRNQNKFVLSPETVIESQRGESGIRNQHELVRLAVTVSESQRVETGPHCTVSRKYQAMTTEVMKTGMNEDERVVIPDILPSISLMLHAAAHRMIDLPFNDDNFRDLCEPAVWRPATTHAEAAARRGAVIFAERVYPHGKGRAPPSGHTFKCWWCKVLTESPNRVGFLGSGWRCGRHQAIPGSGIPVEAENVITLPYTEVPWQSCKREEPISLSAVYDPVKIIPNCADSS